MWKKQKIKLNFLKNHKYYANLHNPKKLIIDQWQSLITLSLSLNHAQASLYLLQIHIHFSQKISISPYSFTHLETHLCNPTSSPISTNPSGSPLNQLNSISLAKTQNGYSFSHHFDQNFSSFSSKIGFCKVYSSGYWPSVCLAKIIFVNLFYYLPYFSTIYGSHCTFWYYSWVSLYYFS